MDRCTREGCGALLYEIPLGYLAGHQMGTALKCVACGREYKVGAVAEPKAPAVGANEREKINMGEEEEKMAEKPMCKRHPDVPAKIGRNGHSTGVCVECLKDRVLKRMSASGGKKRGRKVQGDVARELPFEKKESGGGKERAKPINIFCMRCGFHMELPDPARFADKGE